MGSFGEGPGQPDPLAGKGWGFAGQGEIDLNSEQHKQKRREKIQGGKHVSYNLALPHVQNLVG